MRNFQQFGIVSAYQNMTRCKERKGLCPTVESKSHVVKLKKHIFSYKTKTSETAWLPRFKVVGMTGFEPAASSSRTKRATKLRYISV